MKQIPDIKPVHYEESLDEEQVFEIQKRHEESFMKPMIRDYEPGHHYTTEEIAQMAEYFHKAITKYNFPHPHGDMLTNAKIIIDRWSRLDRSLVYQKIAKLKPALDALYTVLRNAQ